MRLRLSIWTFAHSVQGRDRALHLRGLHGEGLGFIVNEPSFYLALGYEVEVPRVLVSSLWLDVPPEWKLGGEPGDDEHPGEDWMDHPQGRITHPVLRLSVNGKDFLRLPPWMVPCAAAWSQKYPPFFGSRTLCLEGKVCASIEGDRDGMLVSAENQDSLARVWFDVHESDQWARRLWVSIDDLRKEIRKP